MRGKTISLAPLRNEDKDLLFRWINDRELVRWNAAFKPVSYESHCTWFSEVRKDPSRSAFGIRTNDGDRLIGLAQLVEIDRTHSSADLRIKICEPHALGKGVGTEALRLLLDFAWTKLDLHRVSLTVFASNERAIRAYERVGFRIEGRRRQAAFIEGEWIDLLDMAVLRKEDDAAALWRDFTEEAYRSMLDLARAQDYHFAAYDEPSLGRHVLWRHDIDASVHRAVRLAEIEAQVSVKATYFVNPHCAFYNMMEPAILSRLHRIRALGHDVGLHFDADAHPDESWTRERLEAVLAAERDLVSRALSAPVQSFSYHNPDVGNLLQFDDDRLAGMANAYSARLRRDYVYASDSNGYWRFKPIPDVLKDGAARLHILTHPEWWTPEPMPPRARIERCAVGRSQAVLREYDATLARHGRRNLGGAGEPP